MHFRALSRQSLTFALILLAASFAHAQAPQPDRIAPQPDLTRTARLTGHLPAWVNATTDAGAAPDDTPVRLTLLLARTPALQTAFEQLLADQQNPSSSRFHQWLTPTQIGEQFGPTLGDVNAITAWLTASGLHPADLSPSRTFLTVTGTTGLAASAFATTFHHFTYNGQPRLSATTEPTIPAVFGPVLTAVDGLTDIPLHPFHTRTPAALSINPQGNSTSGIHYLFPGDFARVYDIAATTNAGYDGTGSRVAVIGLSRVTTSDVTELEAIAGLAQKAPNTVVIPTSADPGIVAINATDDVQSEALLDVTRVLTTAPGAQADLVIATSAAGGLGAAMQYNVNTLVDPIMTLSFGACESSAGAAAVSFYDSLFAQGAAEGISTFISSGDAAAAGCSPNFSTPTGREVLGMGNFLCASSYATCVGGTEFADAGKDAIYWSPTNSSTFVSVLGYIPEGAWNEPTNTNSSGMSFFQIAGSGSGPSAFIAKPSWQTGTGVPADGARDIPDVAFSSAQHDGYFTCYAADGGDCTKGAGIIFSGTSASAPSMAAIAAILQQRLSKAQGNLNPLLYKLAAAAPTAFHDATPASSGVSPCTLTTASLCNNSVASPTSISGGLAGYPLQVGYDLVTGLGSLDVTNFINAAVANSTTALSPTTTTVSTSPAFIQVNGSAVFSAAVTTTGTAAPSGAVQFQITNTNIGRPVSVVNGVASTPAIAFSTPGSYIVSATYAGDANTATSIGLAPLPFVVASGAPSTISLVVSPNPAFAGSSQVTLSVSVLATTGSATPTGHVNFYANGDSNRSATLTAGKASLTTGFSTTGTFPVTAIYAGDSTFAASTATVNLTVSTSPTTTMVSTSPANPVSAGAATTFTAKVVPAAPGTPTGTVQFFSNATAIGSPAPLSSSGVAQTSAFNSNVAGNYAITAVYSADSFFAASTSAAVSVVVVAQTSPAGLALSSSPTSLSLSSAAANTASGTITASTPNSFTGAVGLACAVTPASTTPPACSLSATNLTFTSAQSATSVVTLSTITPHNRPAAGPLSRSEPPSHKGLVGEISLAFSLLALIPAVRRRRLRNGTSALLASLPAILLGVTFLALSGCGGSSGSVPNPPSPAPVLTGTTAGTYTVTITATPSAGAAVTTTISLVVN